LESGVLGGFELGGGNQVGGGADGSGGFGSFPPEIESGREGAG